MITQRSTGAEHRPTPYTDLLDPAAARRLFGIMSQHPEQYDMVLAAILQAIADCVSEETTEEA